MGQFCLRSDIDLSEVVLEPADGEVFQEFLSYKEPQFRAEIYALIRRLNRIEIYAVFMTIVSCAGFGLAAGKLISSSGVYSLIWSMIAVATSLLGWFFGRAANKSHLGLSMLYSKLRAIRATIQVNRALYSEELFGLVNGIVSKDFVCCRILNERYQLDISPAKLRQFRELIFQSIRSKGYVQLPDDYAGALQAMQEELIMGGDINDQHVVRN